MRKITKNMIIQAVLRTSKTFPNCEVIERVNQYKDEPNKMLRIICKRSNGVEVEFWTDWLYEIPAKTYYDIARFIKDKRLTNIRTNEVVE